jgi:hypothetical protein|tara:strand:+ start:2648 stop:2845 length:198 start_codon:yes stop_codon:yes gene_type:complete
MKGLDRINHFIEQGLNNEEVFKEIYQEASQFKILTKKDKQELADTIAQIRGINVFASGNVPKDIE